MNNELYLTGNGSVAIKPRKHSDSKSITELLSDFKKKALIKTNRV
jgi:hypothetical protein